MICDVKLSRILLSILISITGTSCAPYDYAKTPPKRIGQVTPIYTTDDKGNLKRDIHSEHIRYLSCAANDGSMDCGREIGW
ncbi:hypothetical protein ArsFIN_47860 (plasmid) [Arsenophonus nasoniae]|uniref:Lipoprotein n=1 Tax=Arsenophonus nasoniae TaxID=638 RepID=A0A4P7L0K9_9GAMM|nr:hypothetical protein ArsFIN_47860 [Arsenophonus nasoniae]